MWNEHPSFDSIITGNWESRNNDPNDNRYFQRKRQKEDEKMAKKDIIGNKKIMTD